jgi:histone H3/H4
MSATDKEKYQLQAAEERERVAKELQANPTLMDSTTLAEHGGNTTNSGGNQPRDILSLVLPVARTRKICKLDPDVKGLSREALMLVTKCAELVTAKLALESVRVAQLQNRRKLLPDDVAQVCQTREQFLFLKDDVKDLVQEQRNVQRQHQQQNNINNAATGKAPSKAQEAAAANTKPLTSYFGGAVKD